METHEIIQDGQTYTVTTMDTGHVVTELKMDAAQIAYLEAMRAEITAILVAKEQAFADNLPSWQVISDAIDGATTIAQLKVIIKKMARVLYWIARNSAT